MPVDLPFLHVVLNTTGASYDITIRNTSSNSSLSDVATLLADSTEAALKAAYPDWTSVVRQYVDINYTTI